MSKKDKVQTVSSWDELETVSSWDQLEAPKGASSEVGAASGVDSNAPQQPSIPSGASPEYLKQLSEKNFVKRINNPSKFIKNADGSKSTHKMATAEVDGKQIAFPTIVEQNGKLVELPINEAIDFALKNNEFAEFAKAEDAQWYAEGGYKKGTPIENLEKSPQQADGSTLLPSGLTLDEQRQAVLSHTKSLDRKKIQQFDGQPKIDIVEKTDAIVAPKFIDPVRQGEQVETAKQIKFSDYSQTQGANEDVFRLPTPKESKDYAVNSANSYVEFIAKSDPDKAEFLRQKYDRINSLPKSDRDATDEEFLRDFEAEALNMKFQYKQNELKRTVEEIEALQADPNIDPNTLKELYNKYSATKNTLEGISGAYDLNVVNYGKIEGREMQEESEKRKRFEALSKEDVPIGTYAAEFGKAMFNAAGEGVLSLAQVPKVLGDLIGDTDYDFIDALYDETKEVKRGVEGDLGTPVPKGMDTSDLPTTARIVNVGGNAVGSALLFATGGLIGGTGKLAQRTATFGTAFLTSESGFYEEALNSGMSPQEAATASTILAGATAMIESIIPDVKYLEPSKFRKSVMNEVTGLFNSGMPIKEATKVGLKNVLKAMPESASAYGLSAVKEGGEELLGQVGEDVTKEAINSANEVEYFQDTFNPDNYVDAVLGGFIAGGGLNALSRPTKKSPVQEGVLLDIAESNLDVAQFDQKSQEVIQNAKDALNVVSKHSNWSKLQREEQAHALALVQEKQAIEDEKKAIEGIRIEDKAKEDQVKAIETELNEIFNAPTDKIKIAESNTAEVLEEVKQGEDGIVEPKTKKLYHGTASEIQGQMTPSKKGGVGDNVFTLGDAVYLTENPEAAKLFGKISSENKVLRSGAKLEDIDKEIDAAGFGNQYEVELSENAKIFDVDSDKIDTDKAKEFLLSIGLREDAVNSFKAKDLSDFDSLMDIARYGKGGKNHVQAFAEYFNYDGIRLTEKTWDNWDYFPKGIDLSGDKKTVAIYNKDAINNYKKIDAEQPQGKQTEPTDNVSEGDRSRGVDGGSGVDEVLGVGEDVKAGEEAKGEQGDALKDVDSTAKALDEKINIIEGYGFELDKNNSIDNASVFNINNGEGTYIGKIYIIDKGGAYHIENIRLNKERTGVGYDIYKKLIENLDKPIKSGEVQNEKAKGLWDKLVKNGLAKKEADGYVSIKQKPESPLSKEQTPAKEEAPESKEQIESTAKDDKGVPINEGKWYHGTPIEGLSGNELKPNKNGLIFFTRDKGIAERYATNDYEGNTKSNNVFERKLEVNNIFDPEKNSNNSEIIDLLASKGNFENAGRNADFDALAKEALENGEWSVLETKEFIDGLKKLGYDAIYIDNRPYYAENSKGEKTFYRDIAVFDTKQHKAVESLLFKEQTPPALSDVESTAKAQMSDNDLQQVVGRDVFKQIQKLEEQLGEGVVDRNRMIETAKQIQKADKKDKLLPEHIFEALQYETGFPDNWQDLRNAIKKGGIDVNSEAVQRQIEVGVKLPKDIVEEFKKSERYKNANPELVEAVESLLSKEPATQKESEVVSESELSKEDALKDVESMAKQELNANKLNKEAGVDIYIARQEVESDGSKYYLSQIKENNLTNTFLIEDANGNEIGKAQLSKDGDFLENIRIDEKYRRKGLASKVYDFIELRKGIELEPSPNKQSKEAKALWDKRNLQKSVSNKVNAGLLARAIDKSMSKAFSDFRKKQEVLVELENRYFKQKELSKEDFNNLNETEKAEIIKDAIKWKNDNPELVKAVEDLLMSKEPEKIDTKSEQVDQVDTKAIFTELDTADKGRSVKARTEAKKALKEKYGDIVDKAKDINKNFDTYVEKLKAKGIITKVEC